MPHIASGDDIGEIIVSKSNEAGFEFRDGDVLCVASKAVSSAENNIVEIESIEPSNLAHEIHEKVPRKDVRAIQAIIDATGDPSGSRLEVRQNYIGGWTPNGLFLTSAGVDKFNSDRLILLPKDADQSARKIGQKIFDMIGRKVAIIITDSEGRPDKLGSAQIAIGVYGLPPLRISESTDYDGSTKQNQETACDMLAASAALFMGQRGFNTPAVCIRGYSYEFDTEASISQALNANNQKEDK